MRILIVDDRVPDPHFGAGFPRAYRLLLSLLQLGHRVHFFPTLKQSIKELNIPLLQSYGIEVVSDINKIEPDSIDVAIMSRPHNVYYYMPVVREKLPKAKIIYDTEALWFRRYDLQLEITGRLPSWAYRYDELGMGRDVDLCFVVNDLEGKILSDNGAKRVVKLAHAIEPVVGGLSFEDRRDMLVVGGILEEDSSNEDALWWYLENCWEGVHNVLDCSLNITGKSHSPRLKTHSFRGVNLMGHVDDLVPLYQTNKCFVATTRFATGIPWKAHEAMAHGIPCIISPLLAKQLGVTHGVEALVAENPKQGMQHSIQLYQDKALWEKLRGNGYDLITRDCDIERFKTTLGATLVELVG